MPGALSGPGGLCRQRVPSDGRFPHGGPASAWHVRVPDCSRLRTSPRCGRIFSGRIFFTDACACVGSGVRAAENCAAGRDGKRDRSSVPFRAAAPAASPFDSAGFGPDADSSRAGGTPCRPEAAGGGGKSPAPFRSACACSTAPCWLRAKSNTKTSPRPSPSERRGSQ